MKALGVSSLLGHFRVRNSKYLFSTISASDNALSDEVVL